MKAAVVLCFFAFSAMALARPGSPDEKYTDRYDSVDLDEILGNEKIFTNNVNCILDKGRCPAETKELKSHIEDAMKTNCSKCTDAQRRGTDKVLSHLINKKAEIWNQLKAKYDPTGKYAPEHEKRLRIVKKE